MQRWPVVPNADQRMPSTARSRSASASTTIAFLPPSSRLRRLSRRPAFSAMPVPVAELPVNEITATSGLSTIASPTSAPLPVTRFTTPGGKPASAISSTRSVAQCGVSLDGLKTTVLPVTRAGIVFQHGMAIGKFQGVMIPAMPSGWRIDIAHLSGSSDGTVSPNIRRPSPPSGTRCRSPPGRRRAPRRGPCPSRASSLATGVPCAPPSGRRTGTGSRRAWVQACDATSAGRLRPP